MELWHPWKGKMESLWQKQIANWRCSATLSEDWQSIGFSGHSRWPYASSRPFEDNNSKIYHEAEWIWTEEGDTMVYCRYQVKGRYY